MAVFARPIVVSPMKSQPGTLPYVARGIWEVRNIDVSLEDGSIMSSIVTTLGVRLAELPSPPPVPGDMVAVNGGTFVIEDTDPDGQGGATWTLKALDDPRFPVVPMI